MAPEVRYARSGDVSIAYQVVGDGPFDLVYVPGASRNIELVWEDRAVCRFYGRLSSFSRLIVFDKRGTGCPTGWPASPTSRRGWTTSGRSWTRPARERPRSSASRRAAPMASCSRRRIPSGRGALVVYGTMPRSSGRPDFPLGRTRGRVPRRGRDEAWVWGSARRARELLEREARHDERSSRSAASARLRARREPGRRSSRSTRMNARDRRPARAPTIRVPTLVLHRDRGPLVRSRAPAGLAEQIPGARFVELPGRPHCRTYGDCESVVAARSRSSSTGLREAGWDDAEPDSVLATVLFTDIVGSTEQGGRARRPALARAARAAPRARSARSSRGSAGVELDTAGDGFFARSTGRRARSAARARSSTAVRELGLEVRAGLHTGECELIDGKVAGIAVHIGARVAAQAGPGEVLVSSTVKDLVAGSGHRVRGPRRRRAEGRPRRVAAVRRGGA